MKKIQKLKKRPKRPTFSHDSFFKHFYSDPKLARELIKLIFSKKEIKAYNLNKLKVEKDTFEDKRADLVFSVPLKTHPEIKIDILILLEHKSHYDKHLFDQALDYQYLIRKQSIQQKGYPQPTLFVLFYHGKGPFKWGKSLQEEDFKLFFSKIPAESRKDMLNYGMRVIDTKSPKIKRACRDKNFEGRKVIRLLSGIWDIEKPGSSEVKGIVTGFKNILKRLSETRRRDTILKIMEYLMDQTGVDIGTCREAEVLLIEEGFLERGGVMDIRQHIREKERWEGEQAGLRKGIQKGRKEGRQEVALSMLKEKMSISVISRVTGLSKEEIKNLKNGS